MAQVDYYLKIDGVESKSIDTKHKGEIEVKSWSWGESQSGTAATSGGKVSMQDFHFVMDANKASPKLLLACANGKRFKSAVLTCRIAGEKPQEYLKITLSDVLVSSYQTGGADSGGIVPTDQISLNFAQIEYEFSQPKKDGSLEAAIKAGWNLPENKAIG